MENEIVTVQPTAITPMGMLHLAVSKGADIVQIEKLMELQMRWEANEARKAFNLALSKFKALGITVGKNAKVSYKTDKGLTEYSHASLGNVCDVTGPRLGQFGLSARWETSQEADKIRVTCILAHEAGHSEKVWLESGRDSSGGKNNIQALGSTVSYLERYTLLAITGTATANQDDDGRGAYSYDGEADKPEVKKREEIIYLPDSEFDRLCADRLDPNDPGKIAKMGWKSLITSGTKTSADLIAWAESKGNLTDTQKQTLTDWGK
jgi:hypothetical protein